MALDYGTTANNGNVVSQRITGSGLDRTQSYGYDGVNRLIGSGESGVWSRNFTYDQPGNGWVSSWSAMSPSSFTPQSASWFNSPNRLTGMGATYDLRGNQLAIGAHTFTYDGESRLKTSTINNATTTYVYDGEGRRVKKLHSNGDQTLFIYDAMGQLAAEYTTGQSTQSGTRYVTVDHLGSIRAVTSQEKTVLARRDYLPFGEEIPPPLGGRTNLWTADGGLLQKFTGKERDAESGLDFFEARYRSAAQGRFTSADPITVTPGRAVDPQQLNLYVYARKNPLKYVDPTGMIIDLSELSDEEEKKWRKIVDLANRKDSRGNYVNPKLHEVYAALESDPRTFVIANAKLGAGTTGQFTITKFAGPDDFTGARIALNFDVIKKISSPTQGDFDPSFRKYEGLFGKDGFFLCLAETPGHEGGTRALRSGRSTTRDRYTAAAERPRCRIRGVATR